MELDMDRPRDVVRQAGLMERYHIARFSLGLDSCVLMAAQYILPESQHLDKPTIFTALAAVVKAHPALGVRLIQDPTQDPAFERLAQVDLSQIVEFSDSCDLETAIEAQLLRKFDMALNLPLWRVLIMGDGTICFAWHHAIGDGKSGLAFHRALFASLQTGGDLGQEHIIVPPQSPLIPTIEAKTDVSPSWRKFTQEVLGLFVPVSWTRAASSWTGATVPTDITLQNHVRLIRFPPDVASALLVACRAHKATITSTFYTLAVSIIAGLISPENYKTISSCVPISLRDVTQTSNDAICNHVSSLQSYVNINPSFSWEDAAQYAGDLRAYAKQSAEVVGLLKYLYGKFDAFFEGKLGKKRSTGVELSNVGRFDPKSSRSKPGWSLGPMVFAQCDVVVGAALKLNAVGDALGGITISVVWGAGSISDAFAEEFITQFKSGVEKLL